MFALLAGAANVCKGDLGKSGALLAVCARCSAQDGKSGALARVAVRARRGGGAQDGNKR